MDRPKSLIQTDPPTEDSLLSDLRADQIQDCGDAYVRMGVGGGIFSGKPMTQDLAKTTSCEILPCLLQRST